MVSIREAAIFQEEKLFSDLYEHLHVCGLMAHAMRLQNPTLIKKNHHARTSLPINSLL